MPETIESLTRDEVRSRLVRALEEFYKRDQELLALDANERSISHKIGSYLACQFPEWYVDCEYNRDRKLPKTLPSLRQFLEQAGIRPKLDDDKALTVFPDIIVHRRDTTQNLMVIELKKSTNHSDRNVDLKKLEAFQKDLGYRFPVFLEVSTGRDLSERNWYRIRFI